MDTNCLKSKIIISKRKDIMKNLMTNRGHWGGATVM
nr:MAG TPA: hypothetical protein [Caudoviricetes sp.]